MPYKDKEKQKEAIKQAMRKSRGQGITSGITKESGITTLDTPQDVKAVLTDALGKWHPVDEWTPEEVAAHQAKIRQKWCRPGDWSAAYKDLAPLMGWGRR